jgi:SAM-dependent methyltransferase
MTKSSYPLGHGNDEFLRLKDQMKLLFPEKLLSVIKENDRILDVGCGTADIISQIPASCHYTGIDLKSLVRETYTKLPNVKIKEVNAFEWEQEGEFDVVNFRLILWSVDKPRDLLKKYLYDNNRSSRFYIYEPDDKGLKFCARLSGLEELAHNWQKSVVSAGKNPFIGKEIPSLLSGLRSDFNYEEKVSRREDLATLKVAAKNLSGIFSKYPDSKKLHDKVLEDIEGLVEGDWLEEKYCSIFS